MQKTSLAPILSEILMIFSQSSSIPRSHAGMGVFATEEVSTSTRIIRSPTREDSSNKLIDEGFKVVRKVKDK